jgi:hypothetical protein
MSMLSAAVAVAEGLKGQAHTAGRYERPIGCGREDWNVIGSVKAAAFV